MMRLNHLHPPFNNPKAREALLYLVDQSDYMRVAVGDERNWSVCYAYLVCDAPYGSEAGAESYRKPDLVKARQLLAELRLQGREDRADASDQHFHHPRNVGNL